MTSDPTPADLPERCCGRCALWELTSSTLRLGKCRWPETVRVPNCVRTPVLLCSTLEDAMRDCPCFVAKETR